ncbi:MAG: hypothetical protein COA96_15185 [SAR86 cluster bacterium]|uniref:Uncharacterized protein n=1 Tax=SAR86 cluster bacterium TaxID=2030880 RepID=A0A2A5ARD4_9GAMM|nr:MAG: hypothetical protein COA96_15185 [SAR86 cluster bacterium]
MENNILMIFQLILYIGIILTIQIITVLLLRKPIGRLYDGITKYRLWLLPIVWSCVAIMASSIDAPLIKLLSPLSNSIAPVSERVIESLSQNTYVVEIVSNNQATQSNWDYPYFLAFSFAWLLGIAIYTGLFVSQFMKFDAYLKNKGKLLDRSEKHNILHAMNLGTSVKVWRLDGIKSPAVYGILNRSVLIPENFETGLTASQQRASLSHEAVHYRRNDNLINVLAYILRIIFWFNPLMHIAYRCFRLDQEISCDCRVLHYSTQSERRDYATALISSSGEEIPVTEVVCVSSWNNYHNLKERSKMIYAIGNIDKMKKLKKLLFCILMITGVIGSSSATDFSSTVSAGVLASIDSTSNIHTRSSSIQDSIKIEVQILEIKLSEQSRTTVDPALFKQYGSTNIATVGAYINTDFDEFESVQELLSLNGEVVVLSSPKIQVLNNQKALIQDADVEYFDTSFENTTAPSVVSGNGDKEAFLSGLSLGITPHISDSKEILLRVNPRVSKVTSVNRIVNDEGVDLVESIIRESDSVIKVDNNKITVLGGLVFESTGEEIVILLKLTL